MPLMLLVCSAMVLILCLRVYGNGDKTYFSFARRPVPEKNVSGITFDGTWLWMTIDGPQVIYQIDPESWQVKSRIEFQAKSASGSAWDGVSFWQISYLDKAIYRIDLKSGQILERLPSPGAGMCSGMTCDGKYLWVANFEDKKFYKIDQNDKGKVIESIAGYFEATGIAWDGRYLWNGLLVGAESLGEETPYTGFVQQRDITTMETRAVYPIPGVGAGTSNWTPQGGGATLFWWYDGYDNQIVQARLEHGDVLLGNLLVASLFLVILVLSLLIWRYRLLLNERRNVAKISSEYTVSA
ncbi:MAG TPA: hypothetical protein VKA60_08140 [Blastocatellia bacterium]|nr:hypothetical protein [Blastocatellia bacterium]